VPYDDKIITMTEVTDFALILTEVLSINYFTSSSQNLPSVIAIPTLYNSETVADSAFLAQPSSCI
jgi:hypothetical protein